MKEVLKVETDGSILVNGREIKDAKKIGEALIEFAKVYADECKKQKEE